VLAVVLVPLLVPSAPALLAFPPDELEDDWFFSGGADTAQKLELLSFPLLLDLPFFEISPLEVATDPFFVVWCVAG
jgi:hypothetical protein